MKLLDSILKRLESHGKHRTLAILRGLSDSQLRDMGISRELLNEGVKAWPWREEEDSAVMPKIRLPGKASKVTIVAGKPANKPVFSKEKTAA